MMRKSSTTVVYDKRFVNELEKLEHDTAVALIRRIKIVFQMNWEKCAEFRRRAGNLLLFDLPLLDEHVIVGCKTGPREVLLLSLK